MPEINDGRYYHVTHPLYFLAKHVETKTYTLCGTPLYLAPEVILNQGHDKGADHWSWGILIFEMIAGYIPFYADGIDQITLFRFIVKGSFLFPGEGIMSKEVKDLIKRILVTDPRKRLGSLAGGLDDIYTHSWFTGVDFAALRRKEVEAPWKPEIKDPLDKSKFENWSHLKEKCKEDYPDITPKAQKIFESF
jgi:serine/threonine protein kinase